MGTALQGLTPLDNTGLTSATAHGSSKLGKDQFLKLLLAQLGNQDPLAPTDNQQFIAQLAQFSQVEQAETTNSNLESLLMAQASSNQTSTANFIGKEVLFKSDKVNLGPAGATVSAELAASAATVTITISDANGKVVHTINQEQVPAGRFNTAWNGMTADGVKLPEGNYTVKVEARDAKGNTITVDPRGRARCSGVTFESGYPELILNNLRVKMGDIVQVMEPTVATTGNTNTP